MSLGDRFYVNRNGGMGRVGGYTRRVQTVWSCLGFTLASARRAVSIRLGIIS